MSELIRSFIAVAMPPETVAKLSAAQSRLRPAAGNVKWVSPDSLHVTLKFLGGVEADRLQRTWEAVRRGLTGKERFAFSLRGVGAFPNRNRVRVIWAGMESGRAEMAELAHRVEEACTAEGFAPENRPFQAHVTLGRVREPALNTELAAALEGLVAEEFGEVMVDRVLLMKSTLTPKGPIYGVLEQQSLEEPRPRA